MKEHTTITKHKHNAHEHLHTNINKTLRQRLNVFVSFVAETSYLFFFCEGKRTSVKFKLKYNFNNESYSVLLFYNSTSHTMLSQIGLFPVISYIPQVYV